LLCTDDRWCGSSLIYSSLTQADSLLLSRGIMTLWRHCAEQMQQGKIISLRDKLKGFEFQHIPGTPAGRGADTAAAPNPAATAAPSDTHQPKPSAATATFASLDPHSPKSIIPTCTWESFIRDPITMRTVFRAMGFWTPALFFPPQPPLATPDTPSLPYPLIQHPKGAVQTTLAHKGSSISVHTFNHESNLTPLNIPLNMSRIFARRSLRKLQSPPLPSLGPESWGVQLRRHEYIWVHCSRRNSKSCHALALLPSLHAYSSNSFRMFILQLDVNLPVCSLFMTL